MTEEKKDSGARKRRRRPLSEKRRREVREVWVAADYNISETARRLGISRNTVKRYTKDHKPTMLAVREKEQEVVKADVSAGFAARAEHESKIAKELKTAQDIVIAAIKQQWIEIQALTREATQLREEYASTKNLEALKMAQRSSNAASAIRQSLIKSCKGIGGIVQADEHIAGFADRRVPKAEAWDKIVMGLYLMVTEEQDEHVRQRIGTKIGKIFNEAGRDQDMLERRVFGDESKED